MIHRPGRVSLLLLLIFTLSGVGAALAGPLPGFGQGKRADKRAWKVVTKAANGGDSAALLQRTSDSPVVVHVPHRSGQ